MLLLTPLPPKQWHSKWQGVRPPIFKSTFGGQFLNAAFLGVAEKPNREREMPWVQGPQRRPELGPEHTAQRLPKEEV